MIIKEKNLFVFDLGWRTFDVSIVKLDNANIIF